MEESKQKSNIVKAGIGYTIGNYLIKGLAFLTVPIFSRLLSTTDYGIYNTFVAMEGIMYVIIGMAMHSNYKSARYKYGMIGEERVEPGNDFNTYVSNTMIVVIFSTIFWLFIFYFSSNFLENLLGLNRITLLLLILYSSSGAIIPCFNAYVALKYKYKSYLLVAGLNAVGNILLSIILMLTVFNDKRYMGRIIGSIVPTILISICIVVYFFKKARPQNCKPMILWGIKYSLPIIPNGIGQVILSQFDRIMINKISGPSYSGIYSFAYNIFGLVNVTSLSLDNVWSPWLFEKMHSKNYSNIRKQANIYMLLMLLFSCFILLVSPELVHILGDKSYWDATYCVIPLIAGGFFLFMSSLPISVEYYYEKTKLIAIGTIFAAGINILLNYYYINKYGYIAASYTTLFTYFLYYVFHLYISYRIHRKLLFSNKIIIMCSISIIMGTIFAIVFLNNILIRWTIASSVAVLFLIIEEKTVCIIKKVIRKYNTI